MTKGPSWASKVAFSMVLFAGIGSLVRAASLKNSRQMLSPAISVLAAHD
jgi:hypothetical protein